MIDVVHTKHGKSFIGLVAYLMEGSKGAENPERVDWTATRHLATSRPKLAARVMASTALDAPRLKQKAGVSNVGRKSTNHVLHYTLSPSAKLGRQLTREEWMEAVEGSLAAIGEKAGQKGGRKGKKGRMAVRDQFGSEHQVLIVAHQDTKNPHVHVVVNRVHPEHGVMLPTSDDFVKLSRWAGRFQRQHGCEAVPQRTINNEARDKGQKVYGENRQPRDVYKLEKHARDNHPEALQLQAEQRAKDAALAKRSAETRARCKREWKTLEEAHGQRNVALNEATAKEVNTEHRAIQLESSEKRKALLLRQRNEKEQFENAETHLLGKANNALNALLGLTGGVNVIWSKDAREEAFERKQQGEKDALDRAERKAKREATARIRAQQLTKRTDLGHRYRLERQETILRHQMEKAALRASWKTRQADRKQAWKEHRRRMEQRPPDQSFGRQTVDADEKTKKAVRDYKTLRERREERQRGRDDTERER